MLVISFFYATTFFTHELLEQELLALGERIGNVSTGLSEDSIVKCLTDIGHCLSEQQVEMEESCAICLVSL